MTQTKPSTKVFVAEVQGQDGWPFEGEAIAGVEVEDIDQANSVLIPALADKNYKLLRAGKPRWDETSPLMTREAFPAEETAFRGRRATSTLSVVFLVDVD